jgi:hypothetical protein
MVSVRFNPLHLVNRVNRVSRVSHSQDPAISKIKVEKRSSQLQNLRATQALLLNLLT